MEKVDQIVIKEEEEEDDGEIGRRINDDGAYGEVEGKKDWVNFDGATSMKELDCETIVKVEGVAENQEAEDVCPMLHFEEDFRLGEEIYPEEDLSEVGEDPLRIGSDLGFHSSAMDNSQDKKAIKRSKTLVEVVRSKRLQGGQVEVQESEVSSPPVKSTIVPNPQKQDEPSYITPAEYTPSWTWQDFLTWRTSLLDEGISSPETIPPLTWLVNTYKISAFPCPRCTRFYHTFGTWFRHEAPCEKRCAQPGHKCPDCGFSFTQGRFLETHVRRSHMPLEFLTCTGCGVIFDELKAFNEHVAKESTCLEKAILCKGRGCKRRAYFQTKEAFELHEKTKHCPKDLRPFVCEKCGDKFSSTGILKDHVGKKHMSESGHVTPQRDISSAGARPPRTYSRAVKKAAEKPPDYRLPPCDYCAHGGRSALHYKDAHHDMCVFDVGPDGSEVLRGYRCPRENCDREGRLLVGISAMAYHMKGDCKMKRKKIS